MLNEHLVFLDLETTGATANYDRITEIGMIEVDRGRLIGEWSTLVNPGMRIPPYIQALTGISNDMVAQSPRFADISDELYRRLEGKLLIAHNARFDYGFLRNEFERAGVRYSSRVLCTVKLSRRLFPQHRRHNLDTLMSRHGISCETRHRALGDARVLWQLVQQWHHELDAEKISETVGTLVKTPTVPAGLPDDIYEGIPETPGVYIFYGDNDVVLYVGKSVNMRSRVMAHFSGDRRVSKDMRIAQQIKRCRGACIGAESAERHGLRLAQAFVSMRMQPWPFKGRVGVRENGADTRATELHVLDRWCFLGTARSEHEMHELARTRLQPEFDLDTYKILARFLSKPRGNYSIVELSTE